MGKRQDKLRYLSKLESKNLSRFQKEEKSKHVGQRFHKGDLVYVTKDMPSCMSHFECDQYAIVLGSYNDQYGEDYGRSRENGKIYSLHLLKSGSSCSWYEEDQLTLIEKGTI